MLGYDRWQLFKGLAASLCIVSIVSLALIYFIPAPPLKVVMASGFKGTSSEYFARQYREIFARSNTELELKMRQSDGGPLSSAFGLMTPTGARWLRREAISFRAP